MPISPKKSPAFIVVRTLPVSLNTSKIPSAMINISLATSPLRHIESPGVKMYAFIFKTKSWRNSGWHSWKMVTYLWRERFFECKSLLISNMFWFFLMVKKRSLPVFVKLRQKHRKHRFQDVKKRLILPNTTFPPTFFYGIHYLQLLHLSSFNFNYLKKFTLWKLLNYPDSDSTWM